MMSMTPIEGIAPLWSTFPTKSGQQTAPEGITTPFADIFQSAVDTVKQTEAEKNQMEYLMATGQLDNPALLTTASTKWQLSVELLVQLRNKALEAYSEVNRINL